MTIFHKQVLVQAYVKNAPKDDESELNLWLTELVSDINMNVVIPARSKYVDTKGNEGLTGSINIETSHIAIHIWCEETPNRVECDVYSCKDFDVQTVIDKFKQWDLLKCQYWVIDRNSKFELIESKIITF